MEELKNNDNKRGPVCSSTMDNIHRSEGASNYDNFEEKEKKEKRNTILIMIIIK